ncbi:uncharacterized protein LOC116955095 [Petromyzon marinus]|uniref:Transcriptional repressor scratch 1-like n=1 Tax=Petromyzon marinus TaxID=7757 RepID=A0AAJ7UA45_PETMA|nr:transcriptional repressor scratch 1-like [Petromyzon marinus]
MAALCAEAVLDPREDFPAWLGAHGVSARVLEAVEAELGIGDYEALLACAAQAPVRAELLAAAKERLPFAFYAALRRVAEQVGRGAGGCGGGAGGCGGGHHDGPSDVLALHPFLGSLLDTIVHMLSNLSRELSHSAERFRLLDAATFYGHGADEDRDVRLSSPGHSVQDGDGYGEDAAEASALDMDEDGAAPDGTAVVRWSRGVSSAGLHDGALEPPDAHVAAVGPAAIGAGEAEADDAAGVAEAWRAASVKTEPLHEGEKAGAAEGSLACELDEASAFCQGAVETQDDEDYDNDDIDDNDEGGGGGGGGGATPGRAPRWGSLERGASWADRGHEPPDRWPGNFHPPLPKLESSEGHGSDGAYAQQHRHSSPPPPCSWQTGDVSAAPRLDPTERSRGQQQQQQLPAERFVRSDVECEGLACRAAYAHVYGDDDVVVVTDEQLAHGGGGNSPRVCPDCGMSFRTPSKLCRHRQSRHSEQKPYVCDECGKRFSLIHNLNQHRRIHSGEKPFVCEECGMTFGRKYHLHRHKKTHSIH